MNPIFLKFHRFIGVAGNVGAFFNEFVHIHANPTKNVRMQATVRLEFSKTVKLQLYFI